GRDLKAAPGRLVIIDLGKERQPDLRRLHSRYIIRVAEHPELHIPAQALLMARVAPVCPVDSHRQLRLNESENIALGARLMMPNEQQIACPLLLNLRPEGRVIE